MLAWGTRAVFNIRFENPCIIREMLEAYNENFAGTFETKDLLSINVDVNAHHSCAFGNVRLGNFMIDSLSFSEINVDCFSSVEEPLKALLG